MQHKSLESLLFEANKEIERLSFDDSMNIINNQHTVIIDVREESEVNNSGIIKNAVHVPRGLLEFTLIPNSPNNPVQINHDTYILVYCAGGYRSALAAMTLKDLGFQNIFNLGGYNEWIENGGEIQP